MQRSTAATDRYCRTPTGASTLALTEENLMKKYASREGSVSKDR